MRRVAIAVVACALAVLPSRAQQTPVGLSALEILELYDLGDPVAIKMVATSRPIGSIADEITKGGSAWVLAGGAAEAKRRRVVIAAFALESARHGLHYGEWNSAARLFEWASTELRIDRVPHPAERLWRRALIAYLARLVATYPVKVVTNQVTPLTIFETHLGYAERRFPNESRWKLIRAWIAGLFALGEHLRQPPLETAAVVPPEAARLYEACLKTPELAAEARLHLAFIRLVEGRPEQALAYLQPLDAATTDSDLRSLGHLFSGWALSRQSRTEDAIAAYQRAYDAQPMGQTAALFLSTELFMNGRRSEAVVAVNRTLTKNNGENDPWRLFHLGEYTRLEPLLAELRTAIR